MNKQELLCTLQSGAALVTFTKKDGSVREMKCTLKLDMIPTDLHPKVKEATEIKEEKEESDQIRVYDLDKQGWRSFNFSSVIA